MNAVLVMQQGHCEREVRHQVEKEEREVLAIGPRRLHSRNQQKVGRGENS
jgi:hypothetical protein